MCEADPDVSRYAQDIIRKRAYFYCSNVNKQHRLIVQHFGVQQWRRKPSTTIALFLLPQAKIFLHWKIKYRIILGVHLNFSSHLVLKSRL